MAGAAPGFRPGTRGGRDRLRLRSLIPIVVLLAAFGTGACIGGGPQIVGISPGRGAGEVASDAAVTITFDRAVDQASVASRFHLYPERDGRALTGQAVRGHMTWPDVRRAVYQHPPLRPDTYYKVVLEAGYADRQGSTNGITHGWTFKTESAPTLTGSSPGSGDTGIPPDADLTLTFSRTMSLASLRLSLRIDPSLPLTVVRSPSDPNQVVIAPTTLLDPQTAYRLSLAGSATDVHGNPLGSPVSVSFTTGARQRLSGLVTVLGGVTGSPDGAGVWVIDPAGIPRQVAGGPVRSFAWAPDGVHLLLETGDRTWATAVAGAPPELLPFSADWAASLGKNGGYLYIDGGRLQQLRGDGSTRLLATGVGRAAVAPGQVRVAFTVPNKSSTEIWGLDLGLDARYLLQTEPGSALALAWSPDGTRLAYRISPGDAGQDEIRVRTLYGGDTVATVARGAAGGPVWMPDSRRVLFTALAASGGPDVSKAFLAGVSSPPGGTATAAALPPGPMDVISPSPSPDGHQVAFLSPVDGALEVFTMNADGTGIEQLTRQDARFPYSCLALAWSLP